MSAVGKIATRRVPLSEVQEKGESLSQSIVHLELRIWILNFLKANILEARDYDSNFETFQGINCSRGEDFKKAVLKKLLPTAIKISLNVYILEAVRIFTLCLASYQAYEILEKSKQDG